MLVNYLKTGNNSEHSSFLSHKVIVFTLFFFPQRFEESVPSHPQNQDTNINKFYGCLLFMGQNGNRNSEVLPDKKEKKKKRK